MMKYRDPDLDNGKSIRTQIEQIAATMKNDLAHYRKLLGMVLKASELLNMTIESWPTPIRTKTISGINICLAQKERPKHRNLGI